MNALTMLKADHDAAKKLHENVEEEIFYPALDATGVKELHEIVLEALEEHHLVDDIVEQLKGTPFDDDRWAAKFKVTKENVEHHIKEEEGEMFKLVREHFSKDELEELGDRMLQRSVEQAEGPMPERDQVEL
ncbi:MAG TPA: hemerythrin domain-containing protein [Candidatus Limnocylindria bacterium]